jgi:hypothetical protein
MPVPGWTLPGVTTLGGAQIALKAQGCTVGSRPLASIAGRAARRDRPARRPENGEVSRIAAGRTPTRAYW